MIVVFGSVNADLIFRLKQAPSAGQTLLADDLTVQAGGKGANQAVAAARDGAETVMAGAVGADALADVALAGLRQAGIDLTRVRTVPGPTGCASIWTEAAGDNRIAVALGANALARGDQVEDALLARATALLLQMETDVAETTALLRRSRAFGLRTILNLAPALPLARDVLRLCDLLVVNQDEAGAVAARLGCGAEATALRAALGTDVVRTLGEAGSEAASAEGAWQVPARPVVPVDTTAAGDGFVGVLAASLDRGLPLRAAMERASAAAALACTRPGSQSSLPGRAEIDAALSGA
ncbi:ribokinase [Methylobacterium nonmethylotrophicum]|uniref:Ribokinase n=1 Tax=Methylobacterium nonmethylotrophicum TaxID=1141884 RepID=A0A4Z0NV24_9HYPH|nr:ribokinase [Methylobacterium nonmethylotrophicum]TGE01017.1 ribokinase [Methylobacterium nonmethylotrophicum]